MTSPDEPRLPIWTDQLQAAVADAKREIVLALTEPEAFPALDSEPFAQTLRQMLRANPNATCTVLVDSAETVLRIWPRLAEAARWYSHQLQVRANDPAMERRFDICTVDRRWVAYAPLADATRSGQVGAAPGLAGNPIATRVLEEAVEALKRSSPASWSPTGLGG
jgi:hypothetical protein